DARSTEAARSLARAGRVDRRRIRHRQSQAARHLGAGQPLNLDPGYQGRLKERRMSKPFKGTINVDIRDSVPDWEPFEPPKAPDGAPSVVYIVLDDVGFSAMNCWQRRGHARPGVTAAWPVRTTGAKRSVGHALVGVPEFLQRRAEGHEPAADLLG